MDQEVATQLEELGYHVKTSWPFEDPDEGKSRELDVWAFRRISQDGDPQLCVELFCECKGGENRPFMFLRRRRANIDNYISPEHYVFPHKEYGQTTDSGITIRPAFCYFELADHHYWFVEDTKAVQFAKIVRNKDRWDAQHAGIYNAILLPLAKAISHRGKDIRSFTKPLHLCFPIVVLKSEIYEIDTSQSKLEPKSVPHVSFYRRLDSRSIKGDYIVDFVTLSGLKRFVSETIQPFVERVADLARNSPQKLIVKEPR